MWLAPPRLPPRATAAAREPAKIAVGPYDDMNPAVLRVRRDGSPRGIREPFQFHELRRLPGTSCLRKRRLSAAWEQLQSREIRDWQPLQHYNLDLQARNEAESGARSQRFKSALRTGALRRCSIALARCAK